MPAVGERGERDLGDEAGEEADADDRTERRLADAVGVAEVVEQGEQHAVAGGEEGAHEPEHDDERTGAHVGPRYRGDPFATLGVPATVPVVLTVIGDLVEDVVVWTDGLAPSAPTIRPPSTAAAAAARRTWPPSRPA